MKITVNGEVQEVPDGITAADLVQNLGLIGQRIAMEVNREILPRSQHADHVLQAGDTVEIVRAVGGG